MAADTLESLTARVEALERELQAQREPKKDWRRVVGISAGSEFAEIVIAETLAMRERAREAAREGREE